MNVIFTGAVAYPVLDELLQIPAVAMPRLPSEDLDLSSEFSEVNI